MAPVRTFIRWLKGKKSKDTATKRDKMSRPRQLPPVPGTDSEYGFHVSPTSLDSNDSTHVYEEIPYEEIPSHLRGPCRANAKSTNGNPETMPELDFSGAKTVGPYLVVPIRKGDGENSPHTHTEEYTSIYSMFPEWAKLQLKDSSRKRQGFAISRGYSVDPPAQQCKSSLASTGNPSQRHGNKLHRGNETPSILEKSQDSGHVSDDSDSYGYLRSVSGNGRTSRGDCRQSTSSAEDSLSDLEVFADEIDDDIDYFIFRTDRNHSVAEPKPKPKHIPAAKRDIRTKSVSGTDTTARSEKAAIRRSVKEKAKATEEPKPTKSIDKTRKFHVEAEALVDHFYQPTRQTKPSQTKFQPGGMKRQTQTNDQSTGRTSAPSTRPRNDSSFHSDNATTSNRMSCRISDFQLDRHHRRSMDLRRRSVRNSCSSSSGIESDYAGSLHGLNKTRGNQFLDEIVRLNYDRQFMLPHL